MADWIQYGLRTAKHQSQFSKDPSTKVGACILRPDNTVASVGWNGFARGIKDSDERLYNRDMKLSLTIHAEENAILSMRDGDVSGRYRLFCWPFMPCSRCAARIIQRGFKFVCAPAEAPERWAADFALSRSLFEEAGVLLLHGDPKD